MVSFLEDPGMVVVDHDGVVVDHGDLAHVVVVLMRRWSRHWEPGLDPVGLTALMALVEVLEYWEEVPPC